MITFFVIRGTIQNLIFGQESLKSNNFEKTTVSLRETTTTEPHIKYL